MYFQPTDYLKKIKILTRCYIHEVLKTLENLNHSLNRSDRSWFEEHPQFRHIFHMPRDRNHKLMGMWMLLVRTACTEKKKEAWFVVNGTPIRYGLREHALISGLDCRNYPPGFKEAGSLDFVKMHFKGANVRLQDVKKKLVEMEPHRDRLKMAVLYFLSNIIVAPTKTGDDATPVLDLFQRLVVDLDYCKDFPWGRLSFDYMVSQIWHTMDHFNKGVHEGVLWPIPGHSTFYLPREEYKNLELAIRHPLAHRVPNLTYHVVK